ncbi:hypothetical protein V5O48_016692 [Marasmius crinis-equi]|uniref:Uncharacterized protein n=1 Tax=Marasmius crinis-equi TaxID=585013 RepID=A0ABR3ERA1_9AGAR
MSIDVEMTAIQKTPTTNPPPSVPHVVDLQTPDPPLPAPPPPTPPQTTPSLPRDDSSAPAQDSVTPASQQSQDSDLDALIDSLNDEPTTPGPSRAKGKERASPSKSLKPSPSVQELKAPWKDAGARVLQSITDYGDRLDTIDAGYKTGLLELHNKFSSRDALVEQLCALSGKMAKRVDVLTQGQRAVVRSIDAQARELKELKQLITSLHNSFTNSAGEEERPRKRVNTNNGTFASLSTPSPPLPLSAVPASTPVAVMAPSSSSTAPAPPQQVAHPVAATAPTSIPTPSGPMLTVQSTTPMFTPAAPPAPVATGPQIHSLPVAHSSTGNAPMLHVSNDVGFSVRVHPVTFPIGEHNYTSMANNVIKLLRRHNRISTRVRGRREGASTLLMVWKTQNKAKAFFNLWHEETPAEGEWPGVSVSLDF